MNRSFNFNQLNDFLPSREILKKSEVKISPDILNFIDPKDKVLIELNNDVKDIKENTKNSNIKAIITGVICAIIGGFGTLLIEHFLFG